MDILTQHAHDHPDKAAVIDDPPGGDPTVWSFARLNEQANRLANGMRELGVRPGDKVIWCGMNSLGVVRMIHAARKAGVVAVPLNYRLTGEEAAYIVDNSDAVLVYTDAELAGMFAGIRERLAKVEQVLVFGGAPLDGMLDAERVVGSASPDEPPAPAVTSKPEGSSMIYTSGTTGRPKGAVRTGAGDPELTRRLLERIGYVPEDVYLTTGPLYHSGPGGFMGVAHSLSNTVVLQRKFDPEDWLRLLETHRVSTTFSAPTPIRRVCQLPEEVKARYDRSSLRRMIANAAPWSYALKKLYLESFPADSLWEVYGSTELGVNTVLEPQDQLRKPGSCGKPAPGVEIRLLDPEGRIIREPDTPGELCARSRSAFAAYYKADAKFNESRRDDGFMTVGDMAYFDDEGFYYICDRKNDMIISGGVNIYPAEIEAGLEQHPQVLDVAVIGVPSEEWGESVHAFVVRETPALGEDELIAFAREHLAGYKIPRAVDFVDEIPRNASGKILKQQLREPFWRGRSKQVV